MSVAFGKAPFSLPAQSCCLLAVLPGLAAAVARPLLWSERAAPPRGSPERGFWLWQWVLRAGVMGGAAAWLYARVPPPDTPTESQFTPAAAGQTVPLPGRSGLVCAQGSVPAPPETVPTLACPACCFPTPPLKK